jgi:thiamine biosynthesis lipoprotein
MQLDLGGIGKGYAAQAAVDLLRRRGATRCLVALAGDVVAGDPPPGERGWVIDSPLLPGRPIVLRNAAASTSGDSDQFVEIGGVRYSHIVDPRTGLGLTTGAAVTVVARDGASADSLATAVCVLGAERGAALVRAHPGVSAVIGSRGGGGGIVTVDAGGLLGGPTAQRPPR